MNGQKPAHSATETAQSHDVRIWSDSNLRPIGLALAAAIIIIAIPMAVQIFKCTDLSGGFSLSQLVSFQCKASNESKQHEVTREQLAATPLQAPQGYVAYRVDSGVAREPGSLTPIDSQPAPAFADVTAGLILTATKPKRLRQRPFDQSAYKLFPAGQCFKVITGFRFEDEKPQDGQSGGWLPAELSECSVQAPIGEPVAPTPVKDPAVPTTAATPPGSKKIGSDESEQTDQFFVRSKPKTADQSPPKLSFSGLDHDQFKNRFSLGYKKWTWHVIVKSDSSEEDATNDVERLNARYPALNFEEIWTNENIWAVTLGSGMGTHDATLLERFARRSIGVKEDRKSVV